MSVIRDEWDRTITGRLPQLPGVQYIINDGMVYADLGSRQFGLPIRHVLEMDFRYIELRIVAQCQLAASEAASRLLYGVSYQTVLRVNAMLGLGETDTLIQLEDDLERREREAYRSLYADLTGGGGSRPAHRYAPDDAPVPPPIRGAVPRR